MCARAAFPKKKTDWTEPLIIINALSRSPMEIGIHRGSFYYPYSDRADHSLIVILILIQCIRLITNLATLSFKDRKKSNVYDTLSVSFCQKIVRRYHVRSQRRNNSSRWYQIRYFIFTWRRKKVNLIRIFFYDDRLIVRLNEYCFLRHSYRIQFS